MLLVMSLFVFSGSSHCGENVYVVLLVLMMEAVITSESSVSFYETTRRNNPEDSHVHPQYQVL
jgi:hypothetical protein